MCDTIGFIKADKALFGKNSDRSPNEVQVVEYHPAKHNLSGLLQCTYISIPQSESTNAILISRPTWMWGAEIGVNEFGVCIGNEAVFTRGAYGKSGLTGMDLLRLALERSKNAKEALDLIIDLLKKYGQGGDCGYDHHFYYDNSFLIMDRKSLFILETAGKDWIYKQKDYGSISNRLSIKDDYSECSEDGNCFMKRHLEPIYSKFSGSLPRMNQTQNLLNLSSSIQDFFPILRSHHSNVKNPFTKGTVKSPCMHFGGMVGDHTTASMVVSLEKNRIIVWLTGCSTPCVSLFKPWLFGSTPVLPVIGEGDLSGKNYWIEREHFHRSLLGKKLPEEFYIKRDALENSWLERAKNISNEEFEDFSKRCLEEETEFYKSYINYTLENEHSSIAFRRRWKKKNEVLFSQK